MLKIRIADLTVGIEHSFRHIEYLSRNYLTESEPDFTVRATREEIDAERAVSEDDFSDGYLESVVIYRNIAKILPRFDAFVFHGAALECDGEAVVFTARSGVGKTTHTRLWLSEFSDVDYINGDKPIVRFIDGVPTVFGTPWQGKENYGRNTSAPLRAIYFLERGAENSAREISSAEAVIPFISQIYMPRESTSAALAMSLADRLLSSVKLIRLACNTEPEAARVAYAALGDK